MKARQRAAVESRLAIAKATSEASAVYTALGVNIHGGAGSRSISSSGDWNIGYNPQIGGGVGIGGAQWAGQVYRNTISHK